MKASDFQPNNNLPITITVDLDVDANYDEDISVDDPDDPIEVSAGGIVCVGKRDEIILRKVVPASWVGDLVLTWSSPKVRVFNALSQEIFCTGVYTNNRFPNSTIPTSPENGLSLYVEGETASDTPRDVLLTLSPDPPVGVPDVITYTILKVDLTAIKFNHKGTVTAGAPGPDNETSDGLIIRKNYSTELGHKDHTYTGEWRPSLSRNEPFLYVADKTVTIKARFTITPSIDTTLTIGADSVGGTFPNVTPKTVSFVSGVSVGDANGFVEFDVAGQSHQFDGDSNKDVAKSVDSWKWKITGGIVICDIGVSGPHTNYCVLHVPKTPWYRSAETHPWISALDLACDWAGGAPDTKVAASYLTQNLYNSALVGYFALSQWLDGSGNFKLTDLIAQWTIPSIVAMDCHDCADTVYIFGNLVGCQNSGVNLERPSGNITLKKHMKIGQPTWTVAGELVGEHSVCKGTDGVFDATYKFDDGSLFGKFALGESLSVYLLLLTTDTDVGESGSRQVPIK